MRGKIIAKNDVLKIVDLLRKDYEVIAPFYGSGRDTFFDVVTDENREKVQIHIPNPYYPPKRYVLPHIERLLKINTEGGQVKIEPTYHEKKRAIFGIRSCDVAGIYHLDRFYLDRDFKDVYYEKWRKNLLLVNVVCTDIQKDIDNVCFCVCADTGPAAKEAFDLQLMDLGDEFLAVAGSPQGEEMLKAPIFQQGTRDHLEKRKQILCEVRKNFKTSINWYSAAIRYVTSLNVSDDTWEKIGDRCLECGGCSYVCPACTCFTVTERQIGEGQYERVRIWDSCSLAGFTRMAGGHNPRKAVHDRRNRRFFRKLAHHFIQRELSMACTGCGRCVEECHGDIGMPQVVEILRRANAGKEKDATVKTV